MYQLKLLGGMCSVRLVNIILQDILNEKQRCAEEILL